jgi:hypothetical protein
MIIGKQLVSIPPALVVNHKADIEHIIEVALAVRLVAEIESHGAKHRMIYKRRIEEILVSIQLFLQLFE